MFNFGRSKTINADSDYPFRVCLEFTNSRNNIMTVWLEPWAESLELNPKESIEIVCLAREIGTIPIDFHDNTILVWGMPASKMFVMRDGKTIWKCHQAMP